MKNILLTGAFCTLIFMPVFASAGPILRSGETVSVDASQSLKGDFYGLGSTVTISGQGDNDAYIAGGTVTVNAPIQQDLTIIGGVIQVHGDVGDDIRVVGGEITIAKPVHGDVVVLGDTLTILSTASVDGDVLFMGNNLVIEGVVIGGVHGTVKQVRLNTEIGGDVSLTVKELFTIGDNAKLLGVVTYESAYEVARAQNAVVTNDIQHIDVYKKENSAMAFKVLGYVVCILLFGVLSLYMIGRNTIVELTQNSFERMGVSGLVGIGVFFVMPLVGMLLSISVLGVFVGVILLITYVLLLVLASILAPVFLGYALQKIIFKRPEITFYTVCAGVTAFVVSSTLFVIGGFLIFLCFIVTLGSLSMTLYHAVRDK